MEFYAQPAYPQPPLRVVMQMKANCIVLSRLTIPIGMYGLGEEFNVSI